MKWIFDWLEKCGRKYVMITERGEIIVEKYVLIGSRNPPWGKYPSLSLHHFVYLGPDPFPHTHAGNFWSFVCNGGYVERLEDGILRVRKRFTLAHLPYNKKHDIRKILPNTWTLFFIGFKQHQWQLHRDDEAPRNYKTQWQKMTPELKSRIERLQRRACRTKTMRMNIDLS